MIEDVMGMVKFVSMFSYAVVVSVASEDAQALWAYAVPRDPFPKVI